LIIGIMTVCFLFTFLLPGFDQRFGWSRVPVKVVIIADIVVLLGYGFVFLVLRENSYASRIIEVEKDQKVISSGPYAIVRHPMYLGTAIAAFALILIFQSILSIVLSIIAIVLLWMASKMEDDYNIERFGDSYKKHMTLVPGWNVFKGLKKG